MAVFRTYFGCTPFRPDAHRPLSELNPLPRRALSPEELQRLHAAREREAAERRAAEEEARQTVERAQTYENRRRELLAQTSHAFTSRADQLDYERQVEETLKREFPGYEPPRAEESDAGRP
jgi:hypothetical protein